ncbi:MAG: hypothetical protein R3234_01890 [Thermoanaerobaculia bacterium]|nr:hypothetical protein [Thermoanaerobaculia bacterium]
MRRYRGKETADPGIYFDLAEIRFVSMDEEGRLPGSSERTYRRVPALAMLILAPILSLAYFIFLPLVGFVMLGALVARKLWGVSVDASLAALRVLRPVWEPVWAHLGRRKRADRPEKDRPRAEDRAAPRDDWAEEARRDLDEE